MDGIAWKFAGSKILRFVGVQFMGRPFEAEVTASH